MPNCVLVFLFLVLFSAPAFAVPQANQPKERHFEFEYSGAVQEVPFGAQVRVWIPLAYSNADQEIVDLKTKLPNGSRQTTEQVHGNRMVYFECASSDGSPIPFRLNYEVLRKELNSMRRNLDLEISQEQRQVYSMPNRLVPIEGRPTALLDNTNLDGSPFQTARSLYDLVEKYMTYDKSKPGYGNGDVLWACDSKTGNCTDFHSLFISLARSQKIPAFFEIGFPLPANQGEGSVGGYHCWAKFFVEGQGWIPVDISEADKDPKMKEYFFGNLTENRIGFTRGRDVNLEPRQKSEPLNYFVFPHVEVDGKVWPKEKISLQFQFRDLE